MNEYVLDHYAKVVKKLTEVVRELNREIGNLNREVQQIKEDLKSHKHRKLVQKDKDYASIKTVCFTVRRNNTTNFNWDNFFKEAFKLNEDTPVKLKNASMEICRCYNIKGICDPMFIANTIAKELNIGNGANHLRRKR